MINYEHKDRLFSFIFGKEKNRKWTLSLYNAVNHSAYSDPDVIQITTMGDVLYMGMKNDLSFIITNIMNIYEQQSTYNPNMPLRELMYAARLYDKYVHDNKLNIYGTKLLALPTPKLVVFYNGKEDREDSVLELKDAFRAGAEELSDSGDTNLEENCAGSRNRKKVWTDDEPDIAVRVRMINVNYGRNRELMKACRPLAEYAWFIEHIRLYSEKMDIGKAVGKALDEMPSEFEIKSFLIGNRAEVEQMCITEYNEAETMQMIKEEGKEEGIKIGQKRGIEIGQKEGIEIGEYNKANKMAENMIRANEPGDKIILYTGLKKEDVTRLAENLHIVLVWNTTDNQSI